MLDKDIELIYEQHRINVKILTHEGYFSFYGEVLQAKQLTPRQAYEATEAELERLFNVTKYSSYEAFLNQLSRERKKRIESKQAKRQTK